MPASRRRATWSSRCHSGPPDWGTGPDGQGQALQDHLHATRSSRSRCWPGPPGRARSASPSTARSTPRSSRTWPSGVQIEYGRYVRAGDRFEVAAARLRGRAAAAAPRRATTCPCSRAQVTRRPAHAGPGHRAAPRGRVATPSRCPGLGRPAAGAGRRAAAARRDRPRLRPDRRRGDVAAADGGTALVRLAAAPRPRRSPGPSPPAAPSTTRSGKRCKQPGELTLRTQLDLWDMLRPAVQPGSTLDYKPPPEQVTLTFALVEPAHGQGSGRLDDVGRRRTAEHHVRARRSIPKDGEPLPARGDR